ncbi:hypothetical protein ABZT47_38950 [Sphaerisporangium sp. NPDC005289]|uniref:hypothetical protein n=1 Tax=Sphaerisporangium sp. NPDC005289 TaxID=3155247 RepID=UPI0033BD8C99
MPARNGHPKSGNAATTSKILLTASDLPPVSPDLHQPIFPPPLILPDAQPGSSQPERHLPPAPRRIPVPPAPVRRVTPPRRQPKGR